MKVAPAWRRASAMVGYGGGTSIKKKKSEIMSEFYL